MRLCLRILHQLYLRLAWIVFGGAITAIVSYALYNQHLRPSLISDFSDNNISIFRRYEFASNTPNGFDSIPKYKNNKPLIRIVDFYPPQSFKLARHCVYTNSPASLWAYRCLQRSGRDTVSFLQKHAPLHYALVSTYAIGWPFPSMEGTIAYEMTINPTSGRETGVCVDIQGYHLPLPSQIALALHGETPLKTLFHNAAGFRAPSNPRPIYFLINSIFYGSISAALYRLAQNLRRRHKAFIRIRNGQCPSCGYPTMPIKLVCPECGNNYNLYRNAKLLNRASK